MSGKTDTPARLKVIRLSACTHAVGGQQVLHCRTWGRHLSNLTPPEPDCGVGASTPHSPWPLKACAFLLLQNQMYPSVSRVPL